MLHAAATTGASTLLSRYPHQETAWLRSRKSIFSDTTTTRHSLLIQSNTASTDRLTTEILNSLEQLFVQLDSTPLKAWHHSKSVLEQQIRTRDRSLRVKSQRLWGAIQLGDTSFNRQLRLLDALDKYQLADWLSDIKQKLSQNSGWLRLQTTSQGK